MSYPPATYLGEGGEASAVVRPNGAAPELRHPNGLRVHYLATGASSRGEFGLYRWEMAGGEPTGPAPHFHRTITESFYVLSGAMRLYDGRAWIDAGPGDFMTVPQGGIHGFRNESGEPASMLLLFTPGAPREEYFETLAEAAGGKEMSETEWADFYLRHDNHWV